MTGHHPKPTPFAVLRHDEPGGGHHFDWLLAREPDPHAEARSLIAFRCPCPPGAGAEIDAVRMPDHRAHYLTYQGPLTADRGAVTRIMYGTCVVDHSSDSALTLRLSPTADTPLAYRAQRIDQTDAWRLTPIRVDHDPPTT